MTEVVSEISNCSKLPPVTDWILTTSSWGVGGDNASVEPVTWPASTVIVSPVLNVIIRFVWGVLSNVAVTVKLALRLIDETLERVTVVTSIVSVYGIVSVLSVSNDFLKSSFVWTGSVAEIIVTIAFLLLST